MTEGTVTLDGKVDITPSPFSEDEKAGVTVSAQRGTVQVATSRQSRSLQPARAALGFGTLTLTGDFGDRDEYVLHPAEEPGINRQHPVNLRRTMGACAARGLPALLRELQRGEVDVVSSEELRRGTMAYRARVWVAAAGLLFVELVLVALPARIALDLFGGGYQLASRALEIGLGVLLEVFIALWALTAWIPIAVRLGFARASARDPVRFVTFWGDADAKRRADKESRQGSLVSRPSLPLAVLLFVTANAAMILAPVLGMSLAEFEQTMTQVGLAPMSPDVMVLQVDATVVGIAAALGAAWLLWLFAVSVRRTIGDSTRFRPRWMPLIGAVVCIGAVLAAAPVQTLGGGESVQLAGAGSPYPPGMLLMLTVLLVVAFTSGRLAIGFTTFGVAAVVYILARFGALSSTTALLVLMPVLAPAVPVLLRLTARGVAFVPVTSAQARAFRRRRLWLGWATAVLGIALVVLGIVLYRMAN